MIYAWRYPKSIQRSVMIAVNPPGHFLWDPKTTDALIRRYSRLCAQDSTCSKRTDDLAATIRDAATASANRFWGLPFDEHAARIASFYGLMESTADAAPLNAPMTLSTLISAAKGDPSGLWFLSLMARMAFPESFVWGELAAMGRADTLAAKRYFARGPHRMDSILGNPGTEFLYAGGALVDAWPSTPDENEYARVRDSNVPTLLVGGTLDFATPAVNATRDLLPHLPNGRQVVLSGFGHSTSFWTDQPRAGTRLLNAFFDTGTVDTSLYTPQKVDFTPELTHAALGKGFAGTFYGLPLIAVLSLLLMWRRTRKRGRIGRPASVLLRSAFAIVLGLAGWFAGLVVVLVAFPAVPLDDGVLAVLSVGIPIGAGIHLAALDRNRPHRRRFAIVLAGALVGAWIGFQAGSGLLALITTIVGAALGGNLAAIILDIRRDRVVVPAPGPVPAARPVQGQA
jgi:hypothetical protein